MSTPSNGGISQLASVALMPMQDATTGACGLYAFDPLFGFNDPVNPSVHSYKIEEVMHGRTPTISRIILTYRDLGRVTVSFILTGTQDNGTAATPATIVAQLGNVQQTNKLYTTFFDNTNSVSTLPLTAQNIQLTIRREANAGALSIVKVTLCGRIEKQEYA
jgi:hypothetical protein